ncbi:hypothetical protein GCM10009557_29280 [Virgisporangium ochraceum]
MAITLRAVLETPYTEPNPVPWTVATPEPGSWLTLDGSCGDAEAGLFVAVVADYNSLPPDGLAGAGHLIAPGGLLLADTDTIEIVPGCCCGLEDWRDWARALHVPESPWLGHDPTPGMSFGDRITVWQDTGSPGNDAPVAGGPHIAVSRAELTGMLAGVDRDLTAFAAVLAAWAARHTGDGAALAAGLEAAFAFTAPLEVPPMDT